MVGVGGEGGVAVVESLDRQLHRLSEDMLLDAEAAPPAPFMEAVRARGAARSAFKMQISASAFALVMMTGAVAFLAWPSHPAPTVVPPPASNSVLASDPDSPLPRSSATPAAECSTWNIDRTEPAAADVARDASGNTGNPLAGNPKPAETPK